MPGLSPEGATTATVVLDGKGTEPVQETVEVTKIAGLPMIKVPGSPFVGCTTEIVVGAEPAAVPSNTTSEVTNRLAEFPSLNEA